MAKINIKSPYFIYTNATNLTSAKLELYIYTGTQTTDRGSIKYTLDTLAISEGVTFEISELVRDYLEVYFNGTYTSQMVWVDYQITQSISEVAQTPQTIVQLDGFDGYGYFEDGSQNQSREINTGKLLQSNTTVYKPNDYAVTIGVDANSTYDVTFQYEGQTVGTTQITASSDSTTRIVYLQDYFANGTDDYEERVLTDGGTFEGSVCLTEFLNETNTTPVDTIFVNGQKIKIITIEECKYPIYKLTFINKYGAFQNLWFFKKSTKNISTKDEKYLSNTVVNGSYDVSKHRRKIYTKNGQENMSLNTGFYPEEYNDVFTQLMLSESVWIEINNETLPINIATSNLDYKTELDDKLINYSIEIEFAYDKINNVR